MISTGTHMPVLLECLRATTGSAIEFGCGYHSTPYFSLFACAARPMLTVENDRKYMATFSKIFASTYHTFEFSLVGQRHSPELILNDCAPMLARRDVIHWARENKVPFVICHDTQEEFNWGPTDFWPHELVFRSLTPWTTVYALQPLLWLERALRCWTSRLSLPHVVSLR